MNNLQNEQSLVIGWCVSSLSPNVASVRYRALLPIVALEAAGHTCHLFTNTDHVDLSSLDALVIVKDFTLEAYQLIQRAKAAHVPVIFDLCDNIFVEGYGKHSANAPSEMFSAITKYIDAVVVTTAPLANAISRHAPDALINVIPDGIIQSDVGVAIDARLLAARSRANPRKASGGGIINKLRHKVRVMGGASLRTLFKKVIKRWRTLLTLGFWQRRVSKVLAHVKNKVAMAAIRRHHAAAAAPAISTVPREEQTVASPNAARLLWFGNHGADYADFGMMDLLRIKTDLEVIAQEYDVELVVISNNREKYLTYIKPIAIASRYIEWTPTIVEAEMSKATLALIPNSRDEFSICKSANRSVHALTNGLPVVATSTPSLSPLQGSICIDDFTAGMRRYLSSEQNSANDVSFGNKLAMTHFGPKVISQSWIDTIKNAIANARTEKPVPQVIFVLNLIQDVDVVLPVITEADKRGIAFEVWCSSTLLKKHPRVLSIFQDLDTSPVVLLESEAKRLPAFSSSTRALLTVTETNLAPHVFTRTLTERANKYGLMTATLQHGFENVGLTYSDEIHHVRKVTFAAKKVFLWGPLGTLHPAVKPATRDKCVPIGCPKLVSQAVANLDHMISPTATVIGIFENLHWHRYDEAYRQFFIEGVVSLAERFPEMIFLIKPHQAGLWLTRRYKRDKPVAPNILIVDPEKSEWQRFDINQLLGRMAAVITSPSTVALDAARRGLSVAVVAHDLQLDQYAPLPRINTINDWISFVVSIGTSSAPDGRSLEFVKRTVIEGPAASNILDYLIS
ncbi:glycosyltransferase [Pseudomonas sp. Pseu.R1]|uniref:glycosyltransferase n=1 Tax=Pseudomonas sp. Pseu.R1 TaxID=3379818 RepID=UPI003B9614CE